MEVGGGCPGDAPPGSGTLAATCGELSLNLGNGGWAAAVDDEAVFDGVVTVVDGVVTVVDGVVTVVGGAVNAVGLMSGSLSRRCRLLRRNSPPSSAFTM